MTSKKITVEALMSLTNYGTDQIKSYLVEDVYRLIGLRYGIDEPRKKYNCRESQLMYIDNRHKITITPTGLRSFLKRNFKKLDHDVRQYLRHNKTIFEYNKALMMTIIYN